MKSPLWGPAVGALLSSVIAKVAPETVRTIQTTPIHSEFGTGVESEHLNPDGDSEYSIYADPSVQVADFWRTINPQGGTWSYGQVSGRVRSEYFHPTECHGATLPKGNSIGRNDGLC